MIHLYKNEAIILAGGQSKRMGQNKALLQLNGKTLIENLSAILRNVFQEITIISEDTEAYSWLDIKCIADIIPSMGPLGGIYTGLKYAKTDNVFVVACDMPYISEDLIKTLYKDMDGKFDAIVPVFNGYPQPLCAFYSTRCINTIEQKLKEGLLSVNRFLDFIKTRYIENGFSEFGTNPFFDIDTMADYQKTKAEFGVT